MRVAKITLAASLLVVSIGLGAAVAQLYGPAYLVPHHDWPFTAESRNAFDPISEHSFRDTRKWVIEKSTPR